MRQHLLFLVLLVCIGAPASGIFTLTTFPDSIHHNTQPGYTDAKFMEVTNNGTETAAYSLLTNPTALLASQVAYYPFDNSHTDLLTNTSGTLDGTEFVQNRFSEPQKALSFNGVIDGFVSRSFGLENSFSFSFWAKPQVSLTMFGEGYYGYALYTNYLLFPDWGGFGSRGGLGVALGTNGIMIIEHANSYMPCLLSLDGDYSGWNHFTIVFDNHIPKLYINGVLARTGIASQKAVTFMSNQWGGGVYGHYKGRLDDLCVHNAALTQEQITTAFQFVDEARYSIQPRTGQIDSGQTEQVLVRMIDSTMPAGVYNDEITLCQQGLPPEVLHIPVTINVTTQLVPLAPESITVNLQAGGEVLVQWTAVSMAENGTPLTPTAYMVYQLQDPNNPESGVYLGSTTATQFLDTSASAAANSRFYYVTAYQGE